MNITSILFGLVFFIVGIIFFVGKGHVNLSAWKSMSKDDKSQINIKPLCQNIGGMIMLCGVIFLVSGLWGRFQEKFFIWSMILWLIAAGTDVYFIGKSERYINK